MSKQIFIYGLTESGQTFTKVIYENKFPKYEKEGFKRNPAELPNTIEKLSGMIVEAKKSELEQAKTLKEAISHSIHEDGSMDEETEEELDLVTKSIELLETDIAEKEAVPSLNEKELGEWGAYFEDQVNIENFLLNLGGERSKKKIQAFLDKNAIPFDRTLTLKPLKKIVKKAFHVN